MPDDSRTCEACHEHFAASMGWQPIASAPKIDAGPIDLWVRSPNGEGRREANAWWSSYYNHWAQRLYLDDSYNLSDDGDLVTHWMPLPAPPPYVDDEGNELCQACADVVAREDAAGWRA